MDTPPTEGDSAQALERWQDDVSAIAGLGSVGKGAATGGGEQQPLVAQQSFGAE